MPDVIENVEIEKCPKILFNRVTLNVFILNSHFVALLL